MSSLTKRLGATKGKALRAGGASWAWWQRRRHPTTYRPGTTVVTVNWNSLVFLRDMLDAVRALSPAGTEILVVDNGSTDDSVSYLRSRGDVKVLQLPVNLGHGVGLDLGVAGVDTEYVAVLDIDAFPVSPRWLDESIAALDAGAQIAGAHMHRNFVHPCFFVARTKVLHDLDLTFRPVGSLTKLAESAPLFLDVGEALAQRVIVKFGGGKAMHLFEITEARGPGPAGALFGGLVYHNMYATQGTGKGDAVSNWNDALRRYVPEVVAAREASATGS